MAQILVPFDFSPNALIALDQALIIARTNGAEIEVLHITNEDLAKDYPQTWAHTTGQLAALTQKIEGTIEQRKTYLQSEDVKVSPVVRPGNVVSDVILQRAKESGVIIIVMGTHGITGLRDRLLGTISSSLINRSDFPVLVIPTHWEAQPLRYALVATDLKELPDIIPSVKDLAAFFQAEPRAVQLSGIPEVHEEFEGVHAIGGIPVTLVRSDILNTLAENLREYTKNLKETVLIMHVHQRKLFEKIFDGSKTERTARIIEIPLLSVRKDAATNEVL